MHPSAARSGAIRLAVAVLASAIAVSGVGWIASAPVAAASNAVIDWNAVAGEAARDACLSPDNDPLHEARMYAIAHIAIHDALNAIDRRYEPYTYDAQAPAGVVGSGCGRGGCSRRRWSPCCWTCRRSCSRRRAAPLGSQRSTPPTPLRWRRSRMVLPSHRASRSARRRQRRSSRCARRPRQRRTARRRRLSAGNGAG